MKNNKQWDKNINIVYMEISSHNIVSFLFLQSKVSNFYTNLF
jgi:hypothetical protein